MEIALESLTKSYNTVAAVRGVTLTVHTGELLTLLGPSGCGKTTILRLIAGLERPDAGHVRFDGKIVDDLPPEERGVGLVFQNYALFPHLTVAQNVAYGLHIRRRRRPWWQLPLAKREPGVSRLPTTGGEPGAGQLSVTGREPGVNRLPVAEQVRQLLELVGLPGYERRWPSELSAGQQQRVAIARALAPRPQALLLDEPLSALDARLRDRLRLEIRHLQQQLRLTMVYVTHDQTEALSMSDRVAVLRDGRVEQVGTPPQIYEQPKNRFVATFVGDANLIPVEATGLGSRLADVSQDQAHEGAVYVVRPERLRLVAVEPPAAGGSTAAATGEGETSGISNHGVGAADAGVKVTTDRPLLRGQVLASEFLGSSTRLHVRWQDRELVVQLTTSAPVAEGTYVWLTFDPWSSVRLPAS